MSRKICIPECLSDAPADRLGAANNLLEVIAQLAIHDDTAEQSESLSAGKFQIITLAQTLIEYEIQRIEEES